MREVRGVYYTPEPVVSYIVRSIDHLLKTRFNRPKGLADENTLILDPATGTATFLYFVIDQIYQKFAKQKGAWDGYVDKHLLNRIFGFELLMAPYAIAHLKLGMQLQETGYTVRLRSTPRHLSHEHPRRSCQEERTTSSRIGSPTKPTPPPKSNATIRSSSSLVIRPTPEILPIAASGSPT